MKTSLDEEEDPSVLLNRLQALRKDRLRLEEELQEERRRSYQEESMILHQLESAFNGLSVSKGPASDRTRTDRTVEFSSPSGFKPGTRVWIKKGAHKGHNGVITSPNPRKGGSYWNILLDNPSDGKSTVYKLESHLLV